LLPEFFAGRAHLTAFHLTAGGATVFTQGVFTRHLTSTCAVIVRTNAAACHLSTLHLASACAVIVRTKAAAWAVIVGTNTAACHLPALHLAGLATVTLLLNTLPRRAHFPTVHFSSSVTL
jgi:hypothetical protein